MALIVGEDPPTRIFGVGPPSTDGSLALRGARSVIVVVADPTLDGYLRRGWEPGSLAMLEALKAFVAACKPLRVTFEHIRGGR